MATGYVRARSWHCGYREGHHLRIGSDRRLRRSKFQVCVVRLYVYTRWLFSCMPRFCQMSMPPNP